MIVNKKQNLPNCRFCRLSRPQSENWRKAKWEISTWNLQGNWKNYETMEVTVIPDKIGALGTITKGLIKGLESLEIRGRVETIQTTALLRSARILRRDLETCCHLDSSEKLSANADMKNIQMNKIIIVKLKKAKRSISTWILQWNWKKKPVEHENNGYTNCRSHFWYRH